MRVEIKVQYVYLSKGGPTAAVHLPKEGKKIKKTNDDLAHAAFMQTDLDLDLSSFRACVSKSHLRRQIQGYTRCRTKMVIAVSLVSSVRLGRFRDQLRISSSFHDQNNNINKNKQNKNAEADLRRKSRWEE